MSMVSAATDTNDTEDVVVDSADVISEDTNTNTEVITKKVNDTTTTKESTSSNSKTASKISVNSLTTKYNSTVKLVASVTNAKTGDGVNTGKVVFKINDKTIGYATVSNGQASYVYNTSVLSPKEYKITVKYGENTYFLASSATSTLTIARGSSQIILKNTTSVVNETIKITATVTDKSDGSYATSGKVAFKINGKTIGYANVTNGIAVITYKSLLSAKTYSLNATYGGDKCLEGSRSPMSYLVVKARSTKITLNKASGYSTTVTLKATVVDKKTSKYLTSGTVVFKINDITVGNSSVTNGKASFTYNSSQLTRGIYKFSALLKPTSFYESSSATGNLTILAQSSFTFDQIKTAAVYVRTQYEANKTIFVVPIGKSRIALSEFLALMIQASENAYKGKIANVTYKQYKTLREQYDSFTKVVLNISQVRDIGNRTLSFMNTNGRPPKYVTTDFGKMGYYNIVYTYCRVLDVSSSTYLPSTCRAYSWASMHPSSSKSRTIYLTSDIIFNSKTDYAFMNKIKTKLEAKGYTVVINGYGPNSHNTAIRNQSLPINAVQVSIFGGADAGVIYDICTRSFMRLKESRMMYIVYYPDYCTDITGLSFLKRAWDDNYSVSSFKGIANPDIYLKEHGYDYVYSKNVDTIVKNIINYIS